jgi:hypothetical protein
LKAEFNGQDRILLLGITKALKDSGRLVEQTLNSENFDIILLSITNEEVQGLREFMKHPIEMEMDDLEIIYEYHIQKFGETSIPPEAYISAVKVADQKGTEVIGIDIPSGNYEDLFVGNVQLSDMIFLSLRKRRLMRRRWKDSDPETFSLDWDSYLNKGGYRRLEKERASYMASEIVKRKKNNTIVIMEVERLKDVVYNLNNTLQGYRLQENVEETRGVSSSRPF